MNYEDGWRDHDSRDDAVAAAREFPDVPFLTGIGSSDWHAIPKPSIAYVLTGTAYSVAFAACGELVRVAPKFGAYDRGKSPVTYSPCQPCAWIVAAAGGMAALQVEAARLGPTSDELDRLARLLPDPLLAVNACKAILAEFEDDDEPGNPATLQLLATIAAHAPALLVSEECGDGDCEHDEGTCPSSTVACIACSLVVGDWAGEWQGQLRPECTVKAPCAVLLALAAVKP